MKNKKLSADGGITSMHKLLPSKFAKLFLDQSSEEVSHLESFNELNELNDSFL